MPRGRFYSLLRFIRFADNKIMSERNNKLRKVQDLVNTLNENAKRPLPPGTEVVIDETMVPWQGRLSFKLYIKNIKL